MPVAGALKQLQPIELQQVRRTGDEPLFNSLMEQHHYLKAEDLVVAGPGLIDSIAH